MKALLALASAGVALLVLLPVLVVLTPAGTAADAGAPSDLALDEIPPPYLQLYQTATSTRCPGLDWTVLAAVGHVETRHGTLDAAGVSSGQNFAGAAGPMQFGIGGKAGNTWGGRPVRPVPPDVGYGVDGNRDGIANVYDPADAIHAAAGYLCDHGGGNPASLRRALWAYNHSWDYVDTVLAKADEYATAPARQVSGASDLIAAVLANPRLTIYEAGRDDIAQGRIDTRVLALLQDLSRRYDLYVSSLQTGHSMCVDGGAYAGCNVSNHHVGRAVDIALVHAVPVRESNTAALDIVLELGNMSGPLRPAEVGSPWSLDSPGHFTDAAHRDHIHVGYEQ